MSDTAPSQSSTGTDKAHDCATINFVEVAPDHWIVKDDGSRQLLDSEIDAALARAGLPSLEDLRNA